MCLWTYLIDSFGSIFTSFDTVIYILFFCNWQMCETDIKLLHILKSIISVQTKKTDRWTAKQQC